MLVTTAAWRVDLRGQPAYQGLLTFELGTGRLQQLSQVQVVGQAPLAPHLRQPARGQLKAIQSLAQHGQRALAQPDAVQLAQLLALGVKSFVISSQPGQFIKRHAHELRGQSSTHHQPIQRRGNGPQPQQQISGFCAAKHRILIGQIHRCHGTPGQRPAHRRGLFTSAHQHGYIGWPDALQRQDFFGLIFFCKACVLIHQPVHDLAGTELSPTPPDVIVAQWLRAAPIPGHGQRGQALAALHQLL